MGPMDTNIPVRQFGSSSDPTTALGLGGAVLDRSSFDDGVATVRRAIELGVKYFDTSPMYCKGQSQVIMGEGLSGAADDIMLATKIGYFDTPAGFRSEDAMKRQIEDNLRKLKRDSVDVLQAHEANWACWWKDGVVDRGQQIIDTEEYDFADAPVMRVLRWAKNQGLCNRIGITGNVAHQMARILADVDVDTFLVAFSYDLIVRSAEAEAFPLARERGVVLLLGAIFYGGRLVRPREEWLSDPPDWMTPELQEKFARLYRIEKEAQIPLVEMAVRFALAQPDTSVVLVGCARPSEIEQCANAAIAGPLPDDVYNEVLSLGG